MRNLADNQSNKRFFKVQEDLKRLLSIFSANFEEEQESLEYYQDNGTEEEQKISKELIKSLNTINYETTVKQVIHKKDTKKQVSLEAKKPVARTRNTATTPTIGNNIHLTKTLDDFDREI